MNFCKMCGTSLAAAAAPAAADSAAPPKVACPSCHKLTPSGFAFCQHCGYRLQPTGATPSATPPAATPPASTPQPVAPASTPQPSPQSASREAIAGTLVAESPILPTPPAGMPRATPATPSASSTGSRAVPVDSLASTLGPQSSSALISAVTAPVRETGAMSTVKTVPLPEEKIYATLVVVRRDGSDGESVRVTASAFDIGRTEGGLHFADDPYLAARHARITFDNGKAFLRALDQTNGVYVRLRGAAELHPGDRFLVGKEVIAWEPIAADGHDVPISEHGVRLFGTVPRDAWGRLRQVTASGTTRDVWHLSRPDLVLGREEGDVTFPDDEFMSRRHAAVRRGAPRPKLEDLNSSNGTFLRVRGEHELKSGEMIRLGDQLLRVEL